jgi:hypothetical protein
MTLKRTWRISWFGTVLLLLIGGPAAAQTSDEFWPKLKVAIELRTKTRLDIYGEKQNGEDLARTQWKIGVMGSYRFKRLLGFHSGDIDDEKNHIMTFGAGYEYLHTNDGGSTKTENRLFVQGVPQYFIRPVEVLIQDRSRIEFRWVNGNYSTRYRNKLTVEHTLKLSRFRVTPYAAGELFYDGRHRSWNQNTYSFGAIFPYKKLLSVDTFFLRQNCTTCTEEHVNALGVTLNVFLSLIKKK